MPTHTSTIAYLTCAIVIIVFLMMLVAWSYSRKVRQERKEKQKASDDTYIDWGIDDTQMN